MSGGATAGGGGGGGRGELQLFRQHQVICLADHVVTVLLHHRLASPQLWWPYLSSETPGRLYTLRVSLMSVKHGTDQYSMQVMQSVVVFRSEV